MKQNFSISDKEMKNLENWLKEHDKTCRFAPHKLPKDRMPPLGYFRLEYRFSRPPEGLIIAVKCRCGEEINITDYDSW